MSKFCNPSPKPDYSPGEKFQWVLETCDELDCEGCIWVARGRSIRALGDVSKYKSKIKELEAELEQANKHIRAMLDQSAFYVSWLHELEMRNPELVQEVELYIYSKIDNT